MSDITERLRDDAAYLDRYAEEDDELVRMAERVRKAADEIERLRAALLPFSRLQLPARSDGNAGFYSIFHKHILAARAALGDQP